MIACYQHYQKSKKVYSLSKAILCLIFVSLLHGCKSTKETTSSDQSITTFTRYFVKNSTERICFDKQSVICDFKDTIIFEGLKIFDPNIVEPVDDNSTKNCFSITALSDYLSVSFIDTISNDTIRIAGQVFDKSPVMYLSSGMWYYSGDTIDVHAFEEKMKLSAEVIDLDRRVDILLEGFNIFYNKNGNVNKLVSNSPILSNEIRKELLLADDNSFVIFKDIRSNYHSIQKHNYITPFVIYLKKE